MSTMEDVNKRENQGWMARVAGCFAGCWAGVGERVGLVGQHIAQIGQHFTTASEVGPKVKATVPLTVSFMSVAMQAFWWLTTKEDKLAFDTIKVSFGALVGLTFSYMGVGYMQEGRLRNSLSFLMYIMCAVAILGPSYLIFSSKFQSDDKKADTPTSASI